MNGFLPNLPIKLTVEPQKEYKRSLKAYLLDYLREDVLAEGLTRIIPAFSRFLMHLDIPMAN